MLNPSVKERVQKFDVGNDGELDINEAMQGLITLQKQSNNYKKMLWFLIPVLCLVLLGSFGTTLLALNLTKEVKQDSGLLVSSKSNIPIRTIEAVSKDVMFSSFFSEDYSKIKTLQIHHKEIDVKKIYQKVKKDNTKTVYVDTELVNFSLNETGEYELKYNAGSESNLASGLVYYDIENVLSKFKNVIGKWKEMFNSNPTVDDVAEVTQEFRVTTTKVPDTYEVTDGIIKSVSRFGADACTRSSYYSKQCEKAYGCLTINCPGFTTCKVGHNEEEFNDIINTVKCPVGVSSYNGD